MSILESHFYVYLYVDMCTYMVVMCRLCDNVIIETEMKKKLIEK